MRFNSLCFALILFAISVPSCIVQIAAYKIFKTVAMASLPLPPCPTYAIRSHNLTCSWNGILHSAWFHTFSPLFTMRCKATINLTCSCNGILHFALFEKTRDVIFVISRTGYKRITDEKRFANSAFRLFWWKRTRHRRRSPAIQNTADGRSQRAQDS